jgi:hypothetical protein
MSHSNYHDLMAAALDAPLVAAERAALDDHLETCGTCRARWEALNEVHVLFAAAPVMAAPAGFAERTAARLRARSSRPRAVSGGLILAAASAALFALTAVPLAGVFLALVRQPSAVVALLRAAAALINVLDAVGGGLWLAVFALLDWSAGQLWVSALALAALLLAWAWFYFFQRLSAKAVTT